MTAFVLQKQLTSYDRNYMACKAKNIYYLVPYRKSSPTLPGTRPRYAGPCSKTIITTYIVLEVISSLTI